MGIPSAYTKEEEQTLLNSYREKGDLGVLGSLYEPYMYLVLGVCLKYFKDNGKAEDAVMQIFEELVKKLRVHRVSNFRSWLYTYTRNFCLMELRKRNREPEIHFSEAAFMENSESTHPFYKEDMQEAQLQLLEACIKTLNPNQKECVDLFFFKNKCYKEIANITGYTLNKVKSYIQNGKRNIRICMEKNHEQ